MNKIDLHIHSEFSDDGEYNVYEIMEMCKEKGLQYFAIADHNTIKGSKSLCKQTMNGIKMIPAIEIDCRFEGKDFHLLGYGIDLEAEIYDQIEENIISQEIKGSQKRIAFVRDELSLCFEDQALHKIMKHGYANAEQLMEVCIADVRNHDKVIMKPYLSGGKRSDHPMVNFYWDYFSQGKKGYVEMEYPSLNEMVAMIHSQKGIAVLAHPGNNVKEDEVLLNALIETGIDGLEVYSSYHSEEQTFYYCKQAEDHDLMKTCGSDFHGKTKPTISIGQCEMTEEENEQLKKILQAL